MSPDRKESFGQYLRRERTLREISLEEISLHTKIKLNTLVSLENDDFAHMPDLAFVRGFVRAYAEHLGLNIQEVMLRFSSFINENHPDLMTSPVVARSRRGVRRPVILVFFAFLVLGFFFYSYRYMNKLEKGHESKILSGSSIAAPPPAPPPSPSPPASDGAQGSRKINLKATELCWVQVILDDQPPCEATLYPGDSVSFEAKERIRLLVGNAGGIKIRYNGTSFENLGPSGRPIRLIFPESTGTTALEEED